MAKKKSNTQDKPVYVVNFWKIKLTFRALLLLCVTGFAMIFLVKLGCDKDKGVYMNPGDIDIKYKKGAAQYPPAM